ncbi:hypothetical protein, partial [Mycobacteroides abscessus]
MIRCRIGWHHWEKWRLNKRFIDTSWDCEIPSAQYKRCCIRCGKPQTESIRDFSWIRTHDLHWIAVVQVEAQSENEMSSVTMTLWLSPKMFQLDRP